MKYFHPKLASAGVIAASPVVTLVGANNGQGCHHLPPTTGVPWGGTQQDNYKA